MKTLVLDGFQEAGPMQSRVMEAAASDLEERGWEWKTHAPRDMELAPCTGCFGCWTRRPGECVQEDQAHELCRSIMESELILNITPISFGGYSSSAKAALDRTIGLISPFFTMVGGEVHHKLRYERMPSMATLGINHSVGDGGECKACADIFENLFYRNTINFHPPAAAVEVAGDEERACERVAELLDQMDSLRVARLPVKNVSRQDFATRTTEASRLTLSGSRGKKALALIGSPRVRSTSSSISGELLGRLEGKGWQTDELRILPHLKNNETWKKLTDAAEHADLLVLVTPLYADSLPAPVTLALERLARESRSDTGGRERAFMAILNCGFPEPFHNYTGLAIARQFALETGFEWIGGLPLGMGGAIDGRALAECGRMVRHVLRALDLTAAALDKGDPVPAEALVLMEKQFLPRWLYIAMGNWGWKKRAKKYGVNRGLDARPYQSVGG